MEPAKTGTSCNTRVIKASPDAVYAAFSNPEALEIWLAPKTMTGKMHHFDFRVGGGYEMSLYYPEADEAGAGKTTAKEDRFVAEFTALEPNRRIVQVVRFDSPDPAFSGKMTMETILERVPDGTEIRLVFTGIPPGIKPEDNEKGTGESLEKLARYLETGA